MLYNATWTTGRTNNIHLCHEHPLSVSSNLATLDAVYSSVITGVSGHCWALLGSVDDNGYLIN